MFPRLAVRTINPEVFRIARAETELSGRLDHHIADKYTLLLKYTFTNNREVGDAFNTGGLVDPSGRGSSFIKIKESQDLLPRFSATRRSTARDFR